MHPDFQSGNLCLHMVMLFVGPDLSGQEFPVNRGKR